MKHCNRKNTNFIKILVKDGFICEPCRDKNKFYVYKDGGEKYLIHSGERAFHPLRRWLKNTYNYDFMF